MDPKFSCVYNGSLFQSASQSFIDQRGYIDRAIAVLTGKMTSLQQSLLQAIADREPEAFTVPVGYSPYDISMPAANGNVTNLTFNNSGAIVGLEVQEKSFADFDHPLGLFQYRTYNESELNMYGNDYCLRQCSTGCGRCSFSKCGLDESGAYSSKTVAKVQQGWRRVFNDTHQSIVFNVTFGTYDGPLSKQYGAPAYARLEVYVKEAMLNNGSRITLDFDLTWYGKTPTRMAEALWMTFAVKKWDNTSWVMHKLGKWIDPMNVATNGSKTMHAIWDGIKTISGSIGLESLDAPVVTPEIHNLYPTGIFNGLPRPDDGWSFNLFNNAWSTNYPLWSLMTSERFHWTLNIQY